VRIRDRLDTGQPCFSFEFFPPRTEKGVSSLFRTVLELRSLEPAFVSVTYPGSATPAPDPEVRSRRELTLDLVRRIKAESGIEAMAHLTCSGHTRDELVAILEGLADEGAENVLALRGDPPGGGGGFVSIEGGFSHGVELVRLIRERGYPFSVGAGCYPEVHQEAADADSDLRHLKTKVDAGVDFLITQLFYDNERYFEFLDRARAAGVAVPIIPGIMPVSSTANARRISSFGATIPPALAAGLDVAGEDEEAVLAVGVAHATAQAADLLDRGAPGVHFYTLNTSRATIAVLGALRRQM
jgi:methylenetetrahydrofolate reductase (NADPH)